MYICIGTTFSLACTYIHTHIFIFYIEDFLGCMPERGIPVVCFQIDFNLQRGKNVNHIENTFPEMLCYIFLTKTSGLYSEK